MPTTRRRSTTSAASGKASGSPTPSTDDAAPVPELEEPKDATPIAEEPKLTIRLPLLTVTVARPVGAATPAVHDAHPKGKLPIPLPRNGQRWLFYTGVATLGVAGVVEWPVAAAIAAGTYIAAKSRSMPPLAESHSVVPSNTSS